MRGALAGQFWLVLAEKYDNSTNPKEFLQIYTTMVQIAGGNGKVIANYFPTALADLARSWLMNLPHGSGRSWENLCDQFVTNFQGTYARPGVEVDMYQVSQ